MANMSDRAESRVKNLEVYITANGRPAADIPPVFGFTLIGSIKDMVDGRLAAPGKVDIPCSRGCI